MSEIRFSPQSWSRGAADVDATAEALARRALSIVDRCGDLGRLGCNNGGTLADTALSMILPVLTSAAQEAVVGMAEGFGIEAENMRVTGENYAAIEETNTQLAALIGGN